jgi:hypothetical protein
MITRLSPRSPQSSRQRAWLSLGGLVSGLMLVVSGVHGVVPVAAQTVTAPTVQVEDRLPAQIDDRLARHDRRLDDVFADRLDDRQADTLGRLLHLTSDSVRQVGMDDVLELARGLGIDDQALADMLLSEDVQQEDRQNDRQLEVGDDRLSGQPEQEVQPGDVRQEDRQNDRQLEVGDDRLSGQQVVNDRSTASSSPEHASVSSDTDKSSSGSASGVKPYYGSASNTVPATTSTSSATSSTSTPAKSSGSSSTSGGHTGGHDDAGGHH